MAEKFVSMRNLKFLLYDVFQVESLTKTGHFADHSRETFDLIMDSAMKMATDLLSPTSTEMDRVIPTLNEGNVTVHPIVKEFMREMGTGGWIGAPFATEHGGQQIPMSVFAAFRFILAAANYSASVFPALTTGAAHLIISFGSPELIETYTPKMLAGQWQGTMALTEPQAGSSLADITTRAEPTDKGYYLMRGQKIFISAAEHDAVDNVVHLMLAKIPGGPPGTKGISLFVVPKRRLERNGELVDNDVVCASLYHKLGYKGTPLTQLSIGENGNCHGYLVGEPHRGLSYMFQMMNEARIDVGLGAAAIATAAYYAALEYARERHQGRMVTEKDFTQPQIPIIEHTDVKRMLLFQRSVVEGSLALIIQLSLWSDLMVVSADSERQRYELLVDLLTPVVKSYPSEMGVVAVSQGLQCLGGYGYCDDFPLEQYYRDIRIHPIHEGTTGIQALDLLGRKMVRKGGMAAYMYLEEVNKTIAAASHFTELKDRAEEVKQAVALLQEITAQLVGLALKGEVDAFLADATVFLEFFSIIAIGWQWLIQAISIHRILAADASMADSAFFTGKLKTFHYFFAYELPKTTGLAKVLKNSAGMTRTAHVTHFED